MRLRTIFLNIAALLIGLFLALVILEAGLRLIGKAPPGGVAIATVQNFSKVPGIYDPQQDELDRRIAALPFRVRINSLGYRGPEFALIKPEGEIRVLMTGDSFTFGDFVDDHQTLPAQVQTMLQCRAPVVVVNAGMGGSSLPTQRQLIERGLVLLPDLVILTFYENDIADLESPHWELLAKNRDAKSRFPLSVVYPVIRQLAIWRLLQEMREKWRNRGRLDGAATVPAAAPSMDEQWRARRDRLRAQYARGLEELASFLGKNGIRFIVATFPSHLSLQNSIPSDDLTWIEALGRDLGIETVSFWEPLATSNLALEELYLLPHDGHPTPLAYSLVAAHIVRTIRQGAIQDLCP